MNGGLNELYLSKKKMFLPMFDELNAKSLCTLFVSNIEIFVQTYT